MAFYDGLRRACEKWSVDVVGGDTTASYTGLAISITCIGEAKKEDIVYRNGANETDLICVTGDLGAAYMGLQLLEREKSVFYQQVDAMNKKLQEAHKAGNTKLVEQTDSLPSCFISVSKAIVVVASMRRTFPSTIRRR